MKRLLIGLVLSLCTATAALAAQSGVVGYTISPNTTPDTKRVEVWVPYPMSDTQQDISRMQVGGNATHSAVYRDPQSGALFLHAAWENTKVKPVLTMNFHVNSHYTALPKLSKGQEIFPVEVLPYLKASTQIPCDDSQIKAIASKATKGRKGTLDKARGVYEWVIANTERNPNVKGCGLGKALTTLNEAKGGGKCADISAVYVAIARAAGIPTRDVYGLRSTGKSGEITGDFHCWAEFYLPGTGWVPVDPADVRKAMLVQKLQLTDAETAKWKEFFWAGDDLFRIALNRDSRGTILTPRQQGQPLEYFMYPYGEVDGKPLDYFTAKNFGYTVTFTAD